MTTLTVTAQDDVLLIEVTGSPVELNREETAELHSVVGEWLGPSLIKEGEVAKMLGFSARTLQKWRHEGRGPTFVSISDRCVRYRRQDLTTWIEGLAR